MAHSSVIMSHLPTGKWARPGFKRMDTRAIVMHWTGVAQQRALDVINYWAGRDQSYGSAHYVIDLNGDIYEAIPPQELAYHCGSKTYTQLASEPPLQLYQPTSSPNHHTIGVEMCVIDYEGSYSAATIESAVKLVADLCKAHALNPFSMVLTHQMVVGWKECPKAWVQHPDQFELFRHWVSEGI